MAAPPVAFTHRLRVRFSETDAMGIVHHSRYLPYLEEARVEYLRHLGHPYDRLREEGLDFAVTDVSLRYRRPLRFDELVDVELAVAGARKASFQMEYTLRVSGEVRANARTGHACVNAAGRPVRMPAWFAGLQR